jgi:hypothetical protein
MERQTESPADAPPEPPVDQPAPEPRRLLGVEVGDLLPFLILIGFSAWLWSRAGDSLGAIAPFLGAAIGLAVAYLVRTFC